MFVDDHVVTRAMWSKGLKACWHVSTRARKARWQSPLASEHMSTQDALAREQRLSEMLFIFIIFSVHVST